MRQELKGLVNECVVCVAWMGHGDALIASGDHSYAADVARLNTSLAHFTRFNGGQASSLKIPVSSMQVSF
jgi:L-fucose mutarotase/ribose pyranase (RbsD/FucU family)